jgi:hypothetical protein
MYHMSPDDSKDKGRKYSNDGNHMLDLSTGIRVYLRGQLCDRRRKVYGCALFFKLNGALPADGFAGKTVESLLIKLIIRPTGQSILVREKEKRRR